MKKTNSSKKVLCGNILYKVLIAVLTLIDSNKECPEALDIHEYILQNYCTEGDSYSQILNALERGVKSGFLYKKRKKYCLVCPAATISRQDKPRMFEMERIRSIFSSNCIKKKCNKTDPKARKKLRTHSCGDMGNKNTKPNSSPKNNRCVNMNKNKEDNWTQEKKSSSVPVSKSNFEFYN
ncbi:hypothetical protein WA026_003774 [Henosepilachna vigintioctopunctata]|uniref:H15 domain-containing protein n=1 Tax=Henosepilachna vigintioctopunctata TaxID=420089 RepID=A0AAW1UDB1_9CUCU